MKSKQSKPNTTLGIILAFVFPPAGLALSINAYKKCKKNGNATALPILGIVVSILIFVFIYLPVIIAILDNGMDKAFRQLIME